MDDGNQALMDQQRSLLPTPLHLDPVVHLSQHMLQHMRLPESWAKMTFNFFANKRGYSVNNFRENFLR